MQLLTRKLNNATIISIIGDLDASSAVNLDNMISEVKIGGEKNLLFDCTGLQYISSAGLGVFMSYIQDFTDEGIFMALYGMSDKVKNVFSILGLEKLIKIFNTEEEAIDASNVK